MLLDEIKNIKSTKAELRKFGYTLGVMALLISLVLFLYGKGSYSIFLVTGSLLISLGSLFPIVLKPFQIFWMGLSLVLGWFSTRIILSVLFYFVITPIKYIARIFGKRFLDLEFRKEKNSYWNYRSKKEIVPEDYERQF